MTQTWYALIEKATGRLYAVASIDLDDDDTEVDSATGQPFSRSGLRGIAHPSKMEAKGLEAKALDFNPQNEPEPGGHYEWDENLRGFIVRSGRELKQRELASLKQRVTEMEAELRENP